MIAYFKFALQTAQLLRQVSNLKRAFKLMQLHAQKRTRNGVNH
jgi:hypothetical protein